MNPQIGQQLIIGVQGTELQPQEAEFIVSNGIGGVVLMQRNVKEPAQVRALTSSIQDLRHRMPDKLPLFIAIDMEGGRVQRLKMPFTQWPALAKVGKVDSTSVAFRFAQAMGEELRAVGINLDFAPSLDIFSNPENTVIGDRSLATAAEPVARLGSALIRGYIKAGLLPCAKHFPGHGHTRIDSHQDLPVEDKTLAELENFELEPFKKAFRARVDLVMAAHILFPKIDPNWPACLSEIFLRKILRENLRYRRLVISDDLDMKALTRHHSKATIAVQALKAGCNILLYCNEPESQTIAIEAIDKAMQDGSLDPAIVAENHTQIVALKKEKLQQSDPATVEEIARVIGHPDHLRLAQAILEGTVPADLITNAG